MDVYMAIVGFFQNGGVFMYPIVIVLALGAAVAIERWLFLSRSNLEQPAALEEDHAVPPGGQVRGGGEGQLREQVRGGFGTELRSRARAHRRSA
jgi:hypothetical protein